MTERSLSTIRKAALGAVAALAVGLPMALTAAPAQAVSTGGCTVVPLTPVRVGTIGGVPVVRYSTRVTCPKDRIVQIIDRRLESDAPAGPAGDDSYGTTVHVKTFASAGTIVVSVNDLVTNTEAGPEETYHRVAFRVASLAGVTPFTGYQNSALLSVAI